MTVTVADGDQETEVPAEDYEIEDLSFEKSGKNAGTVTIWADSASKNFTGEKTFKFDIKGIDINDAVITVSDTEYFKNKKNPVRAEYDGTVLVEGEDYVLEYSDTDKTGVASVKITGAGAYTNEVTKEFTISQRNLEDEAIEATLDGPSFHEEGIAALLPGSTISPEVTITDTADTSDTVKSTVLTPGTDYTVTIKGNDKIGVAEVTITGVGNYKGTITKTFEIRYDISQADVAVSDVTYSKDTKAYTPAVSVTMPGAETALATDAYDIVYSANDKTGTATVTITGKGEYTGQATGTFQILPRKLDAESIAFDFAEDSKADKDGVFVTEPDKAAEPKALVTDTYADTDVYTLVENTDYKLSYTSNMAAGKATMTVTGTGNYTGSLNKTFTVKISLSKADCSIEDMIYSVNLTEYIPDVKITLNDKAGTKLTEKDYEIAFKDNIGVGEAKATITGKGDYAGEFTAAFQIKEKNLADLKMAFADGALRDGNIAVTEPDTKAEPKVVVTDAYEDAEDYILKENTDYKLSYKANEKAGEATITVTGTGNYAGSVQKTFTVRTDLSKAVCTAADMVYSAKAAEYIPVIDVTLNDQAGTRLTEDDYDVVYTDNTGVGTAKFTVTGKGDYAGEITGTFQISAKNLSNLTIAFASGALQAGDIAVIEKGAQATPGITVTDAADGCTLAAGKDYTVAYQNNAQAGTASVTVTGIGNYTGTVTKNFTVQIKKSKTEDSNDEKTKKKVSLAKDLITSAKNQKPKSITVKWKKVSNAQGYQVQYTMDKSFKSGTMTKTLKTTSLTVKGLKKKKIYYVRVRAYASSSGSKTYGKWSLVRKIKIKK